MINYTDVRYSFEAADYIVNTANDVAVVNGNEAILQHIITRLMIPRGSFILNPNLGSDLMTLLQRKVTQSTLNQIKSMVLLAIKPEIDAGNVTDDVTIVLDTSQDSVSIKATLTMVDGTKEQINLILQ